MQTCNCGKHVVPTAQIVPVNCEFVIPAPYPYVRPAVDSYECCCCPTSQPSMKDYPEIKPPFVQGILPEGEKFKPFERDPETLEHVDVPGLYPCGEGAGYAGGIVSSALDGINCAEKI